VIGSADADEGAEDNGSDILIAGLTIYDQDLPALENVFNKWRSVPDDYSSRVARVVTDSVAIWDDPFLAAGITVFDDQSTDTLKGGLGLDFFFADLDEADEDDDVQGDWTPGEVVEELAELLFE
jgi:hypothetical protein